MRRRRLARPRNLAQLDDHPFPTTPSTILSDHAREVGIAGQLHVQYLGLDEWLGEEVRRSALAVLTAYPIWPAAVVLE
jgi:hypothetical protein